MRRMRNEALFQEVDLTRDSIIPVRAGFLIPTFSISRFPSEDESEFGFPLPEVHIQ
jgi:hypothetical protein